MNTLAFQGVPIKSQLMFNWFRKKDPEQQVMEQYRKLLAESHRLSTTDRRASDLKRAEAEALLDRSEKEKKASQA
ncbi:MAG: Lacal_2735 family protein [Flavobacteriales bacterium]